MHGVIGKDGNLRTEWNGKMKLKTCPYGRGDSYCSVFCPHLDYSMPGQALLTCGGTAVIIELDKPTSKEAEHEQS